MSSSPPSGLLQRPTTTAATVDDQDERQHDHDLTMEHDSNQDEDMFSTTTNNNNDTNALEASFFPSPSHYYKRYTSYNLSLPLDYPEILHLPNDDNSGGGFTRQDLVPPHLDWVLERGTYTVFGEVWPLDDQLPSLRDMGVEELFDPLQPDRSHSLQTLLQALLVTYHQLVTSLLAPPRSIHDDQQGLPSDPERYVDRIRLIGINLHHSINELRPVQAKESLKAMMRTQIERRKAKTSAIQQ
ncbi:BQ2448_6882 [Microbotryum intermedium]|uniref:Mediator of RNA polymerase II transcription subunit 7 n=1 Tax=Microbotryum intermedium TaxID=269621 RepID=A0A238FI91_9BASI|nr:BQ2448_6882 [Microbotryum intermedium]